MYVSVAGGREEQAGEPAEEQPDEAEGADTGGTPGGQRGGSQEQAGHVEVRARVRQHQDQRRRGALQRYKHFKAH